MLYRFFLSKKGFTFVELMIAVVVLGILTAVGVPTFSAGLKKQRKKDCLNQRTVISGSVKEAMYGMMDNGKSQDKINFDKVTQLSRKTTYPGDGVTGNSDDAFVGKACFILVYDKEDRDSNGQHMQPRKDGAEAFTLGDLRGGYRDLTVYGDDYDGYEAGCKNGNYLKKKDLKDAKFYGYFNNAEIPVCPFADFSNQSTQDDYFYYIFDDGSVVCSCPECNE